MRPDEPELDNLPIFSPDQESLRENLIVAFDKSDPRARPFHLLRTAVLKRLSPDRANLIGITSPGPGDGKSFVSVNLAASLSRVCQEGTGLLDLDLHRGRVAAEIGLDAPKGLSDYLQGTAESLSEIGWRIADTSLVVYPTNAVRADTAALLSSENLGRMLRTLRAQTPGSVYFFDLPPVFANDDTMLVTRHLDGYIMVINAGHTSRKQVDGVLRMLEPTPCLGAIINRYETGVLDGYGYGYGSGGYNDYYA